MGRKIINNGSKIRNAGPVAIIFSSQVKSPFTSGIIKKRIFLPAFLKDNPQSFRIVIAHEFTHIRRRDLWWTMFENLYSRIFWYNPAAILLRKRGSSIREFLCDNIAAAGCSIPAYARVLTETAERFLESGKVLASAVCWKGGSLLGRRVKYLFKGYSNITTSIKRNIIIVIAASLLLLAGFSSCKDIVNSDSSSNEINSKIPRKF